MCEDGSCCGEVVSMVLVMMVMMVMVMLDVYTLKNGITVNKINILYLLDSPLSRFFIVNLSISVFSTIFGMQCILLKNSAWICALF